MSKLNLGIEEVENGYLIHNHSATGEGFMSPTWVAKNHADLAGIIVQLASEADDDVDNTSNS